MNARHRHMGSTAALLVALGCGNGVPDPSLAPRFEDMTGPFAYRAYDSTGALLLVGSLTLTTTPDSTVSGHWTIHWAPGADTTAVVGPQVGTGTLAGHGGAQRISLNLNPGWADNNVFLIVSRSTAGTLGGDWQHSTFVGPVAGGRFALTRTP